MSAVECTVRVEAGAPLAEAIANGGVVCLSSGVHRGPLVLTRSLTIRGDEGAVLDSGGAGTVVSVADDDLVVRIEGVTLRGGHAEAGGGLALTGYSDVVIAKCTFSGNRVPVGGGGGVFASRGTLLVKDSAFVGNVGRIASDLLATGVAEVRVEGGEFQGDIGAREGARLSVDGASIGGQLDLRGTTSRAPVVSVTRSRIRGGVHNDADLPASLTVTP